MRRARNARGAPTDEEQDLLRAMFTFSSAGLDSMVKQLIVDALPLLIDHSKGASESFRSYIERRLYKGEELDHKLIAEVLCDKTPRERLLKLLVSDLISGSLQSMEAVFRVGSFFDIPSQALFNNPTRLTEVFRIRNQINHEMDIDFNQPNRSRRPRGRQAMIDNTNIIFAVAEQFLINVDQKINDRL
jgi:hypothetical protein